MEQATPYETPTKPTGVDILSCAIVLGIATAIWFSWGDTGTAISPAFVVGAVGGLVAVVMAFIRMRGASKPSTLSTDPKARKAYWIAVVAEVVAIAAAVYLFNNVLKVPELTPAIVLVIVGLHFRPLARTFGLPELNILTALCVLVAVIAIVAHYANWGYERPIAGGLGGLVMLLFAWVFIRREWRQRVARAAQN